MPLYQPLTARQKALEVNIDNTIYGSFAEIGAGQEVVRNFFRAGGAAGTVARSISAYDMAMSDALYGRSEDGRYVSIHRLHKMLLHEFETVVDRLYETREKGTRFFAFADTISAKGFRGNKPCHGWLGVRFQHAADASSSEVIIHVKLHDKQAVSQYETIGVLGVNLLHAAFNHNNDYKVFVTSLMDNLTKDSIEIDMISAKGPAFSSIDSRILNLELVTQGHTKIVIFDENGHIQPTADLLYKKNLLVLRGSFRPPTHLNVDMLSCGLTKFAKDLEINEEDESIIVLPEISMNNLRDSSDNGDVDSNDFLARVDLVNALGNKVMITNYDNFYCLNTDLSSLARRKLAFILGVHNLRELFNGERFDDIDFGHLGALGAMFNPDTKVYVYPQREENSKTLLTSKNMSLSESAQQLLNYLYSDNKVEDITDFVEEHLTIWSKEVLEAIQSGNLDWEDKVPETIAATVKSRNLFKKVS